MMRREFPQSQKQQQQSQQSPTTPTTPSPTSPISVRRTRRRARAHRHHLGGMAASSPHTTTHAASQHRHCPHHIKTDTLLARNPALAHKLRQMALPLSPLVQLTTGIVHPDFPATVLHFWLLTDAQLESLAAFYHQTKPSPWSAQYPCPVSWQSDASLEDKRRRMGRFIGLRGCDSPITMTPPLNASMPAMKTEEEIAREAKLAALAAEDEEALRRKFTPGPWSR